MADCPVCGKPVKLMSLAVGECYSCSILSKSQSKGNIDTHLSSRRHYGLPYPVPSDKGGALCRQCGSECVIGDGMAGYCGLRENVNGRVTGPHESKGAGIYECYFDPLPTNCVADWVCAGGTKAGYPDFSYREGPEYGYKNLAVFMGACSFNCLFCQNSTYKALASRKSPSQSNEHLSSILREDVSCICFFGGDPSVQMPFVIDAVDRCIDSDKRGRYLRICLETNGCMNMGNLRKVMDRVVSTGGCIKIDLKAYSSNLFYKLTGQKKESSFKTVEVAASYIPSRKDPPPLVISTLLVPGYVDHREVSKIARFIVDIDPEIPYSLLGFHPTHMMSDLPRTSREVAADAYKAALDAGLSRVRIGNEHLLW